VLYSFSVVLRKVHSQQEKLKQLSERLSDPDLLTDEQLSKIAAQVDALSQLLSRGGGEA
jgi:hypothetical protein